MAVTNEKLFKTEVTFDGADDDDEEPAQRESHAALLPHQKYLRAHALCNCTQRSSSIHNKIPRRKREKSETVSDDAQNNTTNQEDQDITPKGPKYQNTKRRDTIDSIFDFEQDDEDDLGEIHTKNVSMQLYKRACEGIGVAPASYVLRSLEAGNTDITMRNHVLGAAGAKALSIALVNNITVKKLDLTGNDIGDLGCTYISQMLNENPYITSVTLSENCISSKGLQELCDVFKDSPLIKHIDLSGNGFQEDGAYHLSKLLRENRSIEHLSIHHNVFCEKGGEILGPAIASTKSLKVLDLSWNHLRRAGAIAVAEGVMKSKSLRVVNLSWNGFYVEGCRALANALSNNRLLEELDLTCNRINKLCLKELLKGLKENKTLKKLKLGLNPLTPEGAMAIAVLINQVDTIALEEVDLSGQTVESEFVVQLQQLQSKRPITMKYDMVLRNNESQETDSDDLLNENPMMVLMEYMRQKNMRLVDLFTSLDADGSKSLTREEFRDGLLSVNIPLSSDSLDRLIDELDQDGDGEVDFSELMEGQKEHRRKVHTMQQRHHGDNEETDVSRIARKLRSILKARKMIQMMQRQDPPQSDHENSSEAKAKQFISIMRKSSKSRDTTIRNS